MTSVQCLERVNDESHVSVGIRTFIPPNWVGREKSSLSSGEISHWKMDGNRVEVIFFSSLVKNGVQLGINLCRCNHLFWTEQVKAA